MQRPSRTHCSPSVLRSAAAAFVLVLTAAHAGAQDAPVPQWIWASEEAADDDVVYFRGTFELTEKPSAAVVSVSCDNAFEAILNGRRLGTGDDWNQARQFNAMGAVREGKNVLAIVGRNAGGIAALVARVDVGKDDDRKTVLVTDGSWKANREQVRGWQQVPFNDAAWKPAFVRGALGMQPWGMVMRNAAEPDKPQSVVDVTDKFNVAPGFRMEQLYEVPMATQGSWVSMTIDDKGRLIASDQYGGLFRITPAEIGKAGAVTEVEPLDVPIGHAQGLLWAFDSLYVSVNGGGIDGHDSGVYRVTDSDGDGELDKVETIRKLAGGGEHGPHALVLSPDRKWIYVVAGNHTDPPSGVERYRVPPVWGEDHLEERQPDARGHATGRMAPAGWICRMEPDGGNWELVSVGYRNEYDAAFNEHGDLFAYDADMEWDLGTAWYRPTRVCHVTSGSEFGWRYGTGKWPEYFADSLPPVVDIGPGSPTGVVSGLGTKFPAKYQRAIFILDWTFATLYAIHVEPDGSSYTGVKEEFISGNGLPLTDAVVGADGALYFAAGGRRTQSFLYRAVYTGSESVDPITPATLAPEVVEARKTREMLETFHGRVDGAAVAAAWPHLGSGDRFIRAAARAAIESQPASTWQDKVIAEENPQALITGAIALARVGNEELQPKLLEALRGLDFGKLSESEQLELLRAYALTFIRMGRPADTEISAVVAELDPHYPAASDPLNRELCRVLVYLRAPSVVAKTLEIMASAGHPTPPDWARLAARNPGYGSAVLKMLENLPSGLQMHLAYCLKDMPGPWTPGQRKQLFTWFSEASQKSGGNSYAGFIENIKKRTLELATPDEQEMIAKLDLAPPPNPFANLPPVQGPGKNWEVDEVTAMLDNELQGRNFDHGKQMFQASLCFACHRFAGEGGAAGPDITPAGSRFTHRDLVDAIVNPGKVVSDQYQFSLIKRKDGSSIAGRILEEKDGNVLVATNAFDMSQATVIPKADVASVEPSPVSPMPPALINRLNRDELLDLFAYMISGGDPGHKAFKK